MTDIFLPHEREILAAGFVADRVGARSPFDVFFELDPLDGCDGAGVVSVTFEPLILDRAAYLLGIYRDRELVTRGKLLVDVRGVKG